MSTAGDQGKAEGHPAARQIARLLMPAMMLASLALGLFGSEGSASTRAPGAIDPAAPNLTAEEQLALRYAPIAYLKTQSAPCDAKGEPYAPAPG